MRGQTDTGQTVEPTWWTNILVCQQRRKDPLGIMSFNFKFQVKGMILNEFRLNCREQGITRSVVSPAGTRFFW